DLAASGSGGRSPRCGGTRVGTRRCALRTALKPWSRSLVSSRPGIGARWRRGRPADVGSNPHPERLQDPRSHEVMSAEGMSRGSTARALSAAREDRGEVQHRLDRLRAATVEMETEVLARSQLLALVAIGPEAPLRDTASKRVDGAEDVEYLSIRD